MDYLFAPERLEVDGFVLRSWQPGEGALLTEAVDASYTHLSPWLPWAEPSQPVELSEQLCRTFRGRWLTAENFVVAVFDPDERRVLGGTGFHLRQGPLASGNAEIGMWIRAEEAGKGLGTRVLVAMLAWGFDAWPWRRLVWVCDPRNVASARTAEKAGMRLEGRLSRDRVGVDGVWRDSLIYAALREDWRAP